MRDVRELPAAARLAWAERLVDAADARLPDLEWFNSSPCEVHAPDFGPLCPDCGIEFRPHQRVGVLWLYLLYGARGGILADSVGSGKTCQVAGMLAMCKQTSELGEHNRAVIVCQASAVLQWRRELRRFLPALADRIGAVSGSMSRAKRVRAYLAPWEIMVISDRTFSSASGRDGDVATLAQFPVGIVVADDTDALRTHKTHTARSLKALAARATRKIDVNAEPLQKRAMELHSHLEMVGGNAVFGTAPSFRRNFVATGSSSFYQRAMSCTSLVPCPAHRRAAECATCTSPRPCDRHTGVRHGCRACVMACPRHGAVLRGCKACKVGHVWPQPARRCPECGGQGQVDPTGRTVLRTVSTDIGMKNTEEFKHKLRGWVLRRTEFGGEGYPEVQPSQVWVELTPAQRERYDALRRSQEVIRWRDGEVTRERARAIFTQGAQICSGTAALDDGATDHSAKLDRLMRMVTTGALAEEKVVAFVYFKPNVAALSARLDAAGIGHVLFWGNESNAAERDARWERFTYDPDCRLLVGTTTIERSLNLQAAGVLAAVDTVLNPKRMTQIVGRVKRRGSAHQMVRFLQFLALDTQEAGYLEVLRREQGLSDAVWGEHGELYPGLSDREMLRLVAGED